VDLSVRSNLSKTPSYSKVFDGTVVEDLASRFRRSITVDSCNYRSVRGRQIDHTHSGFILQRSIRELRG